MAGQPDSCWTCRFRKKGCDRTRPVCKTCTELELSCHYQKPDWMDGGARQSRMAQEIRLQVKTGSQKRRDRLKAARNADRMGQLAFAIDRTNLNESAAGVAGAAGAAGTGKQESVMTAPPPSFEYQQKQLGEFSDSLHHPVESGCDPQLAIMYLDHVFPFMFPFYKPSSYATGRAWVLRLLQTKDTPTYHSVLSLCSFFSLFGRREPQSDLGKQSSTLKNKVWESLGMHPEQLTVRMQNELEKFKASQRDLFPFPSPSSLLEASRMMQSITQVLLSNLFLGESTSWRFHLTPAMVLLEEMLEASRPEDPTASKSVFESALELLSASPASGTDSILAIAAAANGRQWNTDQAAFRFFTAVLIYVDIVASISLGSHPHLQRFHPTNILGEIPRYTVDVPLDLSLFVGCKNWIMLMLAEVASLSAWKNGRSLHGQLLRPDWMRRGNWVLGALKTGLADLESPRCTSRTPSDGDHRVLYWSKPAPTNQQRLEGEGGAGGEGIRSDDKNGHFTLPSRIWARATRIYLYILMHGWAFRADKLVTDEVTYTLQLLQLLGSTAEFRALAWPICMIGCVVRDPVERDTLREMIAKAGDSRLLSTLNESRRIMEAVWDKDHEELPEDWDLMNCLNIFERPALLI